MRRNIIVLLDVSRSITLEQKEAYINAVTLIFRNLTVRDRLVISTIDGGAFINPARIMSEDFLQAKTWDDLTFKTAILSQPKASQDAATPPFRRKIEDNRSNGKFLQQRRIDTYVRIARPAIRELIERTYLVRKRYANSSNLLWALQNLQSDLETGEESSLQEESLTVQNYIVILSDMVHENDEVSFDRPMGILRTEAEQLLLNLRQNNRIPSLNGAHCICIGRAKTAVIRSEAGVQNIQQFWEGYFSVKNANGRLIAYEAIDKVEQLDDWLKK